MRSGNGLFSGTYPLIYSHPWSFYMRIHYMRAYFWSPYLSNITRSNCIWKVFRFDNNTHFLKTNPMSVKNLKFHFLRTGGWDKRGLVTGLCYYSHFLQTLVNIKNLKSGVDFINLLWAAFTQTDPKSAKKTLKLSVFCTFGICVRKSWS